MILSDGYDTGRRSSCPGDAGLVAALQAHRWLNPLIGWEGYAPSARGMQAALPPSICLRPRTISRAWRRSNPIWREIIWPCSSWPPCAKSRGRAFALATVVRTLDVTAAKAGAKALIGPDGSI